MSTGTALIKILLKTGCRTFPTGPYFVEATWSVPSLDQIVRYLRRGRLEKADRVSVPNEQIQWLPMANERIFYASGEVARALTA
jgi:hypothetical protein